MIQVIFLILMLFLPIQAEAAYKIFLRDGSVISGVELYEKHGSDITLFLKDGSVHLSEEDILRIEEKESIERYIPPDDAEVKTDDKSVTAPSEPAPDTSGKIARLRALKADIDSVNEEIRAVNLEEAQLVSTINKKRSENPVWNKYQMIQMENELKPLSDELRAIQQKKIELLEKKGFLENKISDLQEK